MAADRTTPDAEPAPDTGLPARLAAAIAGLVLFGRPRPATAATQYDDGAFIGEVRPNAGNVVPNGWLSCDGQSLAIASYPDLYAVIGVAFGGDGVTSFNVPDLRGRVAIGVGQGVTLTNRNRGDSGGVETESLSIAEMPSHTHGLRANSSNGTTDRAAGGTWARDPAAVPEYGTTADASLGAAAVGGSGGGLAHNNMIPFLTIGYMIAFQGLTPTP